MFVTLEVSKILIFKEVKEKQLLNINLISVIYLVLNLDKSNDINEKQLLNIYFIFVTRDVSKFEIFNVYRLEHPSNIPTIEITFIVLKLDKSNELKYLQL